MFINRQRHREMPQLNTSSLPDLIFTVLFFFMVVTHMRTVTVKVKYTLPEGRELARLTKQTTAANVFIGQMPSLRGNGGSTQSQGENRQLAVQLNDKVMSADQIATYISEELRRMTDNDRQHATVTLKADLHTPMSQVSQVKRALRRAGIEKINYTAEEQKTTKK